MVLALVDDAFDDASDDGAPAPDQDQDQGRPDSPADALGRVLSELGERISTGSLARERLLPVADELADLFPDGGLVRGRALGCAGGLDAAIVPLLIAARAVRDGAWLAVVDVDTLGLDAATELDLPIERIVRVETSSTTTWFDVVGAAVDGFDLVVTSVPEELRGDDAVARRSAAVVRKLVARLQRRGSVIIVLGDPGVFTLDLRIDVERSVWSGLGDGWGHLRRRSLELATTGRRIGPARRCAVDLVGDGDVVRLVSGGVGANRLHGSAGLEHVERATQAEIDPEQVVVDEMAAAMAPIERAG